MDIKTFLEKLKYGETEPPPKKDYSEILKIIKKKYRKSVTIKLTKSKKVITAAWDPLFPSTIYFSKEFWKTLTPKERLAVIFHEFGHSISDSRYLPHFLSLFSRILFLFGILFLILFLFSFGLAIKNYSYLLNSLVFNFGGLCLFVFFIYLSHREEKFADNFAAKEVGKEAVISALKKIKINKNLLYNLAHPNIEEKIKNLEKNS
jgi:Zn-dependent protease with chaperone function